MIDLVKFSVGPAAGASGAATAEGFSHPISGRILAVRLEANGLAPQTTHTALRDEAAASGEKILDLLDLSAETVYPRRFLNRTDGVYASFDGDHPQMGEFPVHGRLVGQISHSNPGAVVTFTVWIER
jgi:lambda repressor-like predicted transcriptional regulator